MLALSFHVDYWNYIGWTDPFSSPEFTRRRRVYADLMKARYVYTPQAVVDGQDQASGADRSALEALLKTSGQLVKTLITVSKTSAEQIQIAIPAVAQSDPSTVWLALYDRRHETPVRAGENCDRTLVNRNVVRELRRIGVWQGQALTVAATADANALDTGRSGAAVLLQSHRTGAIVGIGTLPDR